MLIYVVNVFFLLHPISHYKTPLVLAWQDITHKNIPLSTTIFTKPVRYL